MSLKQKAKDLHELADQLEHAAWYLYRDLEHAGEPTVCSVPSEPLTYEDLEALFESKEYEDTGVYVYVQELPFRYVTVAVLDRYQGEVLAVYGMDGMYYGRDYGKTWIAYRQPPVFEE